MRSETLFHGSLSWRARDYFIAAGLLHSDPALVSALHFTPPPNPGISITMATTALSASLAQMSALHRNLAVEFENLSAVPAVHNAQSIAQDLRAMKEILQKLTSQMDNVQATLKVHETQNQAR